MNAALRSVIPALGFTQVAVWRGWASAVNDIGATGRVRRVYGFDVDQQLEFYFDASGEIWVTVDCGLCRAATPTEVSALDRGVARGRVEIYRRGPWNSYCDERRDRDVLHRATCRDIPVGASPLVDPAVSARVLG